jgi:hypothetical protein
MPVLPLLSGHFLFLIFAPENKRQNYLLFKNKLICRLLGI